MERFSKDLLKNKREYRAETINYLGNVSMPYPHFHEHYEILYVRENSRILMVNNHDKYILNDKNIALIKPFMLHKTQSDEKKRQKRSLINFSFDTAEEIAGFSGCDVLKCFDAVVSEMSDGVKKSVIDCMDALSALDEENVFYGAEFKNILQKLLIILAKASENKNIRNIESGKGIDETIPLVAKKIQQCHSDDLTLETLAEEFHISPCYLSRCFKNNMGISLTKYINNVRIIAAQKLIDEGYTSVTAIAMQTGFSNITHFDRVFKKITGISPKKYIMQIKNTPQSP